MENKITDYYGMVMIRKLFAIEIVNDFLKNICHIEHSRYNSVYNLFCQYTHFCLKSCLYFLNKIICRSFYTLVTNYYRIHVNIE